MVCLGLGLNTPPNPCTPHARMYAMDWGFDAQYTSHPSWTGKVGDVRRDRSIARGIALEPTAPFTEVAGGTPTQGALTYSGSNAWRDAIAPPAARMPPLAITHHPALQRTGGRLRPPAAGAKNRSGLPKVYGHRPCGRLRTGS